MASCQPTLSPDRRPGATLPELCNSTAPTNFLARRGIRHRPCIMSARSLLVQRSRANLTPSINTREVTTMKNSLAALSVSLALSTLPMGAFAGGYDAGDAALGGFLGGVVGGLIGSGGVPVYAAPTPVVVAPVAPAVVVERPAPVVVERPI
jgi:hypothetical protein